ncbi:MAG: DUF6186 family protein [Acidimicrobiales bacterium]|jgi:hypothetical protein
MTSYQVTLAVWATVASLAIATVVISHLARDSVLKVSELMRIVLTNRYLRTFVILGWMWLGWHLFAR